MTIAKYENILSQINVDIDKFNNFLVEEFKIPHLQASNPEGVSVIANIPWDSHDWGRTFGGYPGVYLLCGYQETDPSRLGVYIGKASMGKNIGNRIWSHLQHHRSTAIYKANDSLGETFIIEAVAAIALYDPRMRALAPALEEFIICDVRDRVYLLNGVGNSG
ncbi:MAG: GIY-YIG nuclease family protein [Chthoniobacter sp.]|uniref:GIY-YIG nuclease family protein n=1 Tax=Chthoniobacter sp. TaxID=2510640 RepID=UPI0032A2775F